MQNRTRLGLRICIDVMLLLVPAADERCVKSDMVYKLSEDMVYNFPSPVGAK